MEADDRTWMRDLGALLALPSLWVDHAPAEIADGLLGVLTGMLRLDAAFARFAGPDAGEPLEVWRPSGAAAPAGLVAALDRASGGASPVASGVSTAAVRVAAGAPGQTHGIARVATLALTLPWGTGMVAVSAPRADFPSERETHLLRVAVGQAEIALHTARRLAAEQSARREAERALERQRRLLRSMLDEVAPALATLSRRVQQVSRESDLHEAPAMESSAAAAQVTATLTRRELEVLGLLAQGLSNKEMAGVMWLSDRTVERHITSLYRKIGVARRSEATAFALRHGIA